MNKICRTCNIEKDISFFGKHIAEKDGLRRHCKSCRSEEAIMACENNPEYRKLRAKSALKYQKLHRDKINLYKREYDKKDKIRAQAHRLIAQRVYTTRNRKELRIEKKPCEKCNSVYRIHAHHPDYTKPLDVKWLCAKHHGEAHRIMRKKLTGIPVVSLPDKV